MNKALKRILQVSALFSFINLIKTGYAIWLGKKLIDINELGLLEFQTLINAHYLVFILFILCIGFLYLKEAGQ